MAASMRVTMTERHPDTDVHADMTLSGGDRDAWFEFMRCRGPVALTWDPRTSRLTVQVAWPYQTKGHLQCPSCHARMEDWEIETCCYGSDEWVSICPFCGDETRFDLVMPVRLYPGVEE